MLRAVKRDEDEGAARIGRPPIAGVALAHGSIRLTPDEWARVDAFAVRAGISRAQALRRVVTRGLTLVERTTRVAK